VPERTLRVASPYTIECRRENSPEKTFSEGRTCG
jgi:hypothetical protein